MGNFTAFFIAILRAEILDMRLSINGGTPSHHPF